MNKRPLLNQEWITDRLPTEEDRCNVGFVWIPREDEDGWESVVDVEKGKPWMPIPRAPEYIPMKTAEEWFELLPDGYRELAIKNEDRAYEHYQHMPESLGDAINYSFDWSGTKEGDDFWSEVHVCVQEGNLLDARDLPDPPNVGVKFNLPEGWTSEYNINMKVKHILDTGNKRQEEKLVFTHELTSSQEFINIHPESPVQPNSWDHVRHVVDDVFYAWDNGDEKHGTIFIGEYR